MRLLDTYSYILANWINSGGFSNKNRLKSMDIQVGYNTIFTKNSARKIMQITGIKPVNVDVAIIDYLREQLFVTHPDVELIINISNYPIKISTSDDRFQRQLVRATEAYETYKEAFESQSGVNKLLGKTYRLPNGARLRLSKDKLDELYQVYASFIEIFNRCSSGEPLALVNIFFELVGRDIRQVNLACDSLYGLLSPLRVGATEVRTVCKSYLKEFGVASTMPDRINKKFLPQLLFTTANMSAFNSFQSRGLVGCGENPLLFGIDIRTKLPFSIDIFQTASAQVFLIMAKTGCGKTYTSFQVALSALALGEYVSALDVKGREWVRITPFTKSKVLTFDEKNPNFVNTLRLDDIEVTDANCSEVYNTAVRGTIALLSLIVNLKEHEGNQSDLELILREAVTKTYSRLGIDENNPSSFKASHSLQYRDVLPILESLSTTKTYTAEQCKMAVLARTRCYAFFGESGVFANAFRNEVTLHDVMDAKLVIYELNKNSGSMTDSLDVLRIFMVQYLDSKKKAMLREKGKFIFCFYEELQRCEQFGNLLEYICADVTGSRSNNAVIVLLMNSLKVLSGERAQDIRSNITSYLIGRIEESDIKIIRNEFGLDWLAGQCELFEQYRETYRNAFAASIDTGNETFETVYKSYLPVNLSNQFQTRTTKGSKGNKAVFNPNQN